MNLDLKWYAFPPCVCLLILSMCPLRALSHVFFPYTLKEKLPGDAEKYNDIIQHETIRVAVCGMIENDSGLTIPPMLVTIMQKTFLEYYDLYESVAQKNIDLTGQPMQVHQAML